mmetsp:Transcript_6011/g.18459  ORF Transcript_6011/g.18459 Transcript_6011/m.18459 type:complete len:106 (-) Transcript_6011:378-695(-)
MRLSAWGYRARQHHFLGSIMLQARAYLSFEADGVNLRDNYVAILTEAARHLEQGVSPSRLMGIDAPRLLASAKLFVRIASEQGDEPVRSVCDRVVRALEKPSPNT